MVADSQGGDWADVHSDGLKFHQIGAVERSVEPVTSHTAEWLLEISDLRVGDRSGQDPVASGQELASQLRAAATRYRAVSPCGADGCSPRCPLAGYDGGAAACRLAHRLADPSCQDPGEISPDRATARYLGALRAAAPSVFACRRQAHPAGECWFGEANAQLCGDVLAVTHRMGL